MNAFPLTRLLRTCGNTLRNWPTSTTEISWPGFLAAAAISFVVVWIVTGGQENVKQSGTDKLHPLSTSTTAPIPAVATPERPFDIKRLETPTNLPPSNSATEKPTQELRPAAASATNPALAQKPTRMNGADLFINLEQYLGKEIVLTDGGVFDATNSGALINAGGVTLWMSVDGINHESLHYFLKNCSGIGGVLIHSPCKMPLLFTLTGEKRGGYPVVKNLKIEH